MAVSIRQGWLNSQYLNLPATCLYNICSIKSVYRRFQMAGSKLSGDFILRILVGLLFVVIGIEGIGDFGGNALYDELDEVFDIIVGIVLLVAGLLLIVPLFVSGIKASFTKVATLVILVAWIVYIVLADFVYGLKGVNGTEWFEWLEDLIYHLLILASVYKVATPAVRKLGTK